MLIIQCASCGAPISPEWKYCSHCGRNFNSDKIDIRTAANIKQRFANVQDVDSSDSSPGEEHNTRGLRHFDDEDYETAIEEFRAAIDCDPDNSSYHCNLAVALDEMGEDDQAKKEYEIALKLDPDDTTALLYLGYMYSENSDVENAEKVWRHLIEIAPNTAESKEALEGLQHLSEI